MRSLVPGERGSADVFRSAAFRAWEDRASVRRKPARRLELPHEGCFFSPELYPVCDHPLVVARGPSARRFLLIRRLYDYLHFTTELETLAVIPVATMISRGHSGLPLSRQMRGDAYKIVTDEAYHAQFSYDLGVDVSHVTGVERPASLPAPAFLGRLDDVRAQVPWNLRGIEALLFSIVSETLISGVLGELPGDTRLPKAVRDLIRDHAEDEGRHHAYFRTVLRALWDVLTPRERTEVAGLVPAVIYAFLEPDYREVMDSLEAVGLPAHEVEQVVRESFHPEAVAQDVAAGAAPVLQYLRDLGAFEEESTVEAFAAAGLWAGGVAPGRPPRGGTAVSSDATLAQTGSQ